MISIWLTLIFGYSHWKSLVLKSKVDEHRKMGLESNRYVLLTYFQSGNELEFLISRNRIRVMFLFDSTDWWCSCFLEMNWGMCLRIKTGFMIKGRTIDYLDWIEIGFVIIRCRVLILESNIWDRGWVSPLERFEVNRVARIYELCSMCADFLSSIYVIVIDVELELMCEDSWMVQVIIEGIC